MSKSDLQHKRSNMKRKLEELEELAKDDPLKKNWKLHEEIAEFKRKLAKSE